MQLIFYKDSIFLRKHQRCAGLFVKQNQQPGSGKQAKKELRLPLFPCPYIHTERQNVYAVLPSLNYRFPKGELLGSKRGTFSFQKWHF
jgi:hypothetical protein